MLHLTSTLSGAPPPLQETPVGCYCDFDRPHRATKQHRQRTVCRFRSRPRPGAQHHPNPPRKKKTAFAVDFDLDPAGQQNSILHNRWDAGRRRFDFDLDPTGQQKAKPTAFDFDFDFDPEHRAPSINTTGAVLLRLRTDTAGQQNNIDQPGCI